MATRLFAAPSPHIHGGEKTRRIMLDVILALIPALAVSTYVLGWRVLFITAVAVVGCLVFEYLISRFLLKRGSTIGDLSAIVTGMLLAFNLPAGIPWWIVLVGALVAIGIGKMTFGGLGCNPFNPALTGRIFLLIAYPVQMTDWTTGVPDALSGSTLLADVKYNTSLLSEVDFLQMLGGHMNGSMGEIGALALILGGLYLLWRKVITWHIPVAFIGTTFLFTLAVEGGNLETTLAWVLSGGLILGACFMATDYVTRPITRNGQYLFGIFLGVMTGIFRIFGPSAEGVSYAIIIGNLLVPLIEKITIPKPFGKGGEKA